jgi:hypothetical protein
MHVEKYIVIFLVACWAYAVFCILDKRQYNTDYSGFVDPPFKYEAIAIAITGLPIYATVKLIMLLL